MGSTRIAVVNENVCVCCGACTEVCPMAAITTPDGCHARVDSNLCVGCGKCSRICPTGCITIMNRLDLVK